MAAPDIIKRHKPAFLIALFMFFGTFAGAQNLMLSIAKNYTGRNFRIGYQYPVRKIRFESGLKYHINNPPDSRGHSFYLKSYAPPDKPWQRICLYNIIQVPVLKSKPLFKNIYFLHHIDFNNLGFKGQYFSPTRESDIDTLGRQLHYAPEKTESGYSISNEIGFGIRSDVRERFGMFAEGGLGFDFVRTKAYNITDTVSGIKYYLFPQSFIEPFSYHVRFGLAYKLVKGKNHDDI